MPARYGPAVQITRFLLASTLVLATCLAVSPSGPPADAWAGDGGGGPKEPVVYPSGEVGADDFRLSDMGVNGDANVDANLPAVAHNTTDDNYLVVWSGDDLNGLFEIYGQFVDANGFEFEPNDFPISNSGGGSFDAFEPSVAYNETANEFLVVWSTDAGNDNAEEIYAQRVSITGALIGGAVRISDMGAVDTDGSFDANTPDVVWNENDNQYLVVWSGDDTTNGEFEIYGQRLSSLATEVGTNDFRISVVGPDGNGNHDALSPAVVHNRSDNEYLVVWEADIDGFAAHTPEIYGQRLTGGGSELGVDDFRISGAGGGTGDTRVSKNPDVAMYPGAPQYMVVFDSDGLFPGEFEIHGQRLDRTGAEIGDDDFRISDMGPDGNPAHSALNPRIAFDSTVRRYLVVWQGDDAVPGEDDIYGQVLNPNGAGLDGNDVRLSTMGPDGDTSYQGVTPAIAMRGEEALVVWSGDDLTPGEREIHGQLFAMERSDLIVNFFTAPAYAYRGALVGSDINVRVTNVGAADLSETFGVGLYISNDPNITTADDPLVDGLLSIAGLDAGATKVLAIPASAAISAGAPLGNVFIGALADYPNGIAELDEGNNTAALPIEIGADALERATVCVTTEATAPVSLMIVPDGSGDRMEQAQLWDGVVGSSPAIVDATLTAVVRDALGNGVPGVRLQVESELGNMVVCPDGALFDAPTDANGKAVFSGPIAGGGSTTPSTLGSALLIDCDEGQISGDNINRGFYVDGYPGTTLDRVDLWTSTNLGGSYTFSLTARLNAYDGPLLGTVNSTVSLPSNTSDNQLTSFDFGSVPVPQGSIVTFAIGLVSGAGGGTLYAVSATPGSCPIIQTNGTAPPLDSFRRDGIRARIFGTVPGAGPGERLIVTSPDGPIAQTVYGNSIMYGCDASGQLFEIDVTTGSATPVCFLPTDATEIEHDNATGRSWVQAANGGFAITEFVLGDCSAVGATIPTASAAFNGLEFVDGTLYGTGIVDACTEATLYKLDPDTATFTPIGPTLTGRPVSGLAYDTVNDVLYGVTGCGNAGPADLVQIDRNTGAATLIGSTDAILGSLEFGPDCELYAGGGQVDGGILFRIDRNTGAAFPVGSTGLTQISGLTLVESGGFDIAINSPDVGGDLGVDLLDVGPFAADLAGAYDYRSDLSWNGVIDLTDVGRFAAGIGASCATPEAPVADAGGVIGLYFDTAGNTRAIDAEPGTVLDAYLLMRGEAADAGISAWEAKLSTSRNVELLEWTLPEGAINFARAPEFIVGLGSTRRAADGEPLQLAKVKLRVRDESPAHVFLHASDLNSGGLRTPAATSPGKRSSLSSLTLDADGSGDPVAFINDANADNGRPSTPKPLALRNAPNPFNPATEFRFNLPRKGLAEISIFDLSGRLVRRLGGTVLDEGAQTLRWTGRDDHGREVGSGIYLYRLRLDDEILGQPRKMTLLK